MARRQTRPKEEFRETTTIESKMMSPEGELEEITREVRMDAGTTGSGGTPNPIQPMSLERSANYTTTDLAFWAAIRKCSEAMSFSNYLRFIDMVLCGSSKGDKAPPAETEFGQAANNQVPALQRLGCLPATQGRHRGFRGGQRRCDAPRPGLPGPQVQGNGRQVPHGSRGAGRPGCQSANSLGGRGGGTRLPSQALAQWRYDGKIEDGSSTWSLSARSCPISGSGTRSSIRQLIYPRVATASLSISSLIPACWS